MTQIAKVAVAAATYAIDKPYDYLVPSGMELSVGCRVTVPFGRGNRTAEGMVLQLRQEVPAKPLKAIRSLLDQEPVLSEKEIRLAPLDAPAVLLHLLRCPAHHPPGGGVVSLPGDLEPLPHGRGGGPYGTGAGGVRMLSDGPQERETPLHRTGGGYPVGAVSDEKKGLVSVETETSRKVKDHMVELASLAAPAQEVLERLGAAAGPPPGSRSCGVSGQVRRDHGPRPVLFHRRYPPDPPQSGEAGPTPSPPRRRGRAPHGGVGGGRGGGITPKTNRGTGV